MTSYNFDVTYTEGGRSATSNQTLVVYDSKVSELLFNGANAGTVFTDTTGRVWTRSGNAQTSTAQFAEGTASLLLDGTGDYLSTPSTTDIQNQGDWRMECSIRLSNLSNLRTIVGKRPTSGTTDEFIWYVQASGKMSFTAWAAGSVLVANNTGNAALAINTWYDVAVEKVGLNYRLLINNAEDLAFSASAAGLAGSAPLIIGRDQSTLGTGVRDFAGYIDRFRFLRA